MRAVGLRDAGGAAQLFEKRPQFKGAYDHIRFCVPASLYRLDHTFAVKIELIGSAKSFEEGEDDG